jgi:tetratricopeptide (TPR) repeat protein
VGWGLGSLTSGWGYGSAYYNPYYVAPVASSVVSYDYSQPVVVQDYLAADSGDAPIAREPSASEEGLALFDEGLAQFKSGNYSAALKRFDAALQKLPGDPVVHEVRALALFALGEYQSAAAALNSFLSSAPGMDWSTMSGLYGDSEDYTRQLRALEEYARSKPTDPSSHFVLAYHYLALGSKEDAVNALRVVVENQPKDSTAKRMLDALAPPEPQSPAAPASTDGATSGPQTDLVGTWRAKAGTTTVDLVISEDSAFVWTAAQAGKPPVELKGQLTSSSDQLVLESAEQGSLTGSVKSLGPDQWQFTLSGSPPSDPGLTFARTKN